VKNLLLAIAIALSSFAHAQGFTTYKVATVDTKKYVVEYRVRHTTYFVPSTTDGHPHYDADITVYQYNGRDTYKKLRLNKRINTIPIKGIYVKEGCFEDDPKKWVRRSFNYAPKQPPIKLRPDRVELLIQADKSAPDSEGIHTDKFSIGSGEEYLITPGTGGGTNTDTFPTISAGTGIISGGFRIVGDTVRDIDDFVWGNKTYRGNPVVYDTAFGIVQTMNWNTFDESAILPIYGKVSNTPDEATDDDMWWLDQYMHKQLFTVPAYQVTASCGNRYWMNMLETKIINFQYGQWPDNFPVIMFIKKPKKK
jgi:hypothetical protein